MSLAGAAGYEADAQGKGQVADDQGQHNGYKGAGQPAGPRRGLAQVIGR